MEVKTKIIFLYFFEKTEPNFLSQELEILYEQVENLNFCMDNYFLKAIRNLDNNSLDFFG